MDGLLAKILTKCTKRGECLIYEGTLRPDGYGTVYWSRYNHLAHRAAYERTYGPVPSDRPICHKCNVRLCCNVEHLYVGTARSNAQDAITAGTISRGESHYATKLTEEDIRKIRTDVRSLPAIAADYGVRKETIFKIKRKTRWSHVL